MVGLLLSLNIVNVACRFRWSIRGPGLRDQLGDGRLIEDVALGLTHLFPDPGQDPRGRVSLGILALGRVGTVNGGEDVGKRDRPSAAAPGGIRPPPPGCWRPAPLPSTGAGSGPGIAREFRAIGRSREFAGEERRTLLGQSQSARHAYSAFAEIFMGPSPPGPRAHEWPRS